MIHEIHEISFRGHVARLATYFLDNSPEIDSGRIRPVVVVCPGGGYEMTSDREAEAVAVQFCARGYHAAVLRYSCSPEGARYPVALCQLSLAVAWLRENCKLYHLDPDRIVTAGFSAGGHLAANLGVAWQESFLDGLTGTVREQRKPNGQILGYPVISSEPWANQETTDHLLGPCPASELLEAVSLERHVTGQTPPTFLWHTYTDDTVPVENSFLFASALRKAGVSLELHIYPRGIHGLGLANEETKNRLGLGVQRECQNWIDMAGGWISREVAPLARKQEQLQELLTGRRTYRRFDQSRPVPDQVVREILRAQQVASSGNNRQRLRYLVIRTPELVEQVFPLTRWAASLPEGEGTPRPGEHPVMFIAVLEEKAAESRTTATDAGLALSNMTLAAWNYGVGSCIMGSIQRKPLKELLGVPDHMEIYLMAAFGYPACASRIREVSQGEDLAYYLDRDRDYVVPKLRIEEVTEYR